MPVLSGMKKCLSITRSLAACEVGRSSRLPSIFGLGDTISGLYVYVAVA
jgi:hypothetical protein